MGKLHCWNWLNVNVGPLLCNLCIMLPCRSSTLEIDTWNFKLVPKWQAVVFNETMNHMHVWLDVDPVCSPSTPHSSNTQFLTLVFIGPR